MTNAHSFPLLKLPNEEQIRVLRNLEDYSILFFSLISKNAKALINSLELKTEPVFVVIGADIELFFCSTSVRFYGKWHRTDEESIRMLCRPENVIIWFYVDGITRYHYFNLDMELEDWIDHVLFIYNLRKLYSIWFDVGCERFDLEAIKKSIPLTENIKIDRTLNEASANAIIKTYPRVDDLTIERNIFDGRNQWRKLFVENFANLRLGNIDEISFEPMDFDSLLICNAKDVAIENCIISEKEVNCFLKLWIKGSNSRMEFLNIAFSRRTISMETIIKGLKCQDVNTTEPFTFRSRSYNTLPINRTVAMFDIYRRDGIKGTIVFRDVQGLVLAFHVYQK